MSLSLNRKGLLSRRQLTSGPEFGVTLAPADQLNGFHVIFGIVLEGQEVLDAIALVPTYSYKTKTGKPNNSKFIGIHEIYFLYFFIPFMLVLIK